MMENRTWTLRIGSLLQTIGTEVLSVVSQH
jgi:hypothetical protein